VVLSGMDSDGALGSRAIKGEGGITLVQAPESARYPEMPRSSISADHVDMVLPPWQIGRQLSEFARRYQSPDVQQLEKGGRARDEEKYFSRILKQLKSVSGVDFRLYKPSTLRRRLARRMLMHRINTLAEYASILQNSPKELRELQEDILISVTRLFRDPEVFEALKEAVFNRIFQERAPDQQVRVWVAGCSSGEEVYSIAISMLEVLAGTPVEPPIQIFGTDASEASVQRARLGLYPESIVNEVSPERLRRFFVKTEKGYQVAKRIRDLCIFARQNLCNDPPFSRLDLISCRNVLIYFGSHLQRQLIPTFHYALRQDGHLLLGNSETIREFHDLFSLTDRKYKIYTKIGTTPARALVDVVPRVLATDLVPEAPLMRVGQSWTDMDLQRSADRIVLARYGPPGVVVNEQLEILQSRGHTSPFLELAQGTASLQLGRMVRESIAPQVTAAVRRAIEQDMPIQLPSLRVRDGDQIREATLEVLPMHNLSSRSRSYLVLFVPPHGQAHEFDNAAAAEPAQVEAVDAAKDRTISQLRHDLSSSRMYLQSLLEERDAKNQELISANEEIQSANEELQSTNEELETTKEELQSSNEELQTVNDELQNRNKVLIEASNDLSNLLNSVNLPVLMLSSDFAIRHFTPQTQRLMNVRASDIGRPFGDIRLNLNTENLEPIFTEVLDTLGSREIEVQDRDGHWYLLRVRPYRTTDNKIDGVVVVLVDIDQLRRSQQELREARDFARAVTEAIPLPLAVVDKELRIRSTNEAFCALTGSTPEALDHRVLPDLAAALWGMENPLHALLQDVRSGQKGEASLEFHSKANGGKGRTLLVRVSVLEPDGQQFLLVTFEDITAHKEVERLLNAERERLEMEVKSTAEERDRNREELRALAANLLTSHEEEHRRLARELHDDLSQRIAAVHITGDQIVQMLEGNPGAAKDKLQQCLTHVAQIGEDMRLLSHRLHPSIIEDLGLGPALRSLTEEFGEREGMIASFHAENVPEGISPEVGTALYRIAQEALRNVAKHAGKTHVKVILAGKNDAIEMQITDAGKGFDPEQAQRGLGFISMRERARLIGATVKVESALRHGTRIIVHSPLGGARRRIAMPKHEIFVIGASSGGVEALSQIARELHAGFPGAIFVVLHTPARTRSFLPGILTRAGQLEAVHPEDGEAIEHGKIYVAPPDHHLIIERGHVHLSLGPKEQHHRPSINVSMRSAALAYGERVVGVVLTGELDDGTAGLWEIKRRGGVAIVQNPEEASFPSMPLSAIREIEADHISKLCSMGDLFMRLATADNDGKETEIEVTSMQPELTDLTCPDCRGTIWEVRRGNWKEYRCRVGHTFSPKTMFAEHFTAQEKALYKAIVALEEGASLAARLSDQFEPELRERLQAEAKEREMQADTLRKILRDRSSFSLD
jgi:two-component system CheB/CheR fusion protein